MSAQTFTLVAAGRAIRCLRCGLTSWNPDDVRARYCGYCHAFLDNREEPVTPMPFADAAHVAELLEIATMHGPCCACGQYTAMDYCRSCDEFYWIHQPGCRLYEAKHFSHRLTIVPFVEGRDQCA
jgi:hypothetical protein